MNKHQSFPPVEATSCATTPAPAGRARRLRTWISNWFRACADYYAAAATYEQLSRLSDAELQRRGLTRARLARDVTAAFDQANGRR